jgi:hypothetical protein
MIWAGNFNRNHSLWDNDEDKYLFTQQAVRFVEGLIELLATYEMTMALPKGAPTLQHMVTGRYSRPDNVFSMTGLSDLITRCEVIPSLHTTSTDDFPIVTNLMLPQEKIDSPPSFNFREVNWDDFNKKLKVRLSMSPNPRHINNQEQLDIAVESLTLVIQDTIRALRSSPVRFFGPFLVLLSHSWVSKLLSSVARQTASHVMSKRTCG